MTFCISNDNMYACKQENQNKFKGVKDFFKR